MTLRDRLRQLASALPSDASAVTLTRADIVALLKTLVAGHRLGQDEHPDVPPRRSSRGDALRVHALTKAVYRTARAHQAIAPGEP